MKTLIIKLTLCLLIFDAILISAQNSIILNSEKIRTRNFLVTTGNPLNRMKYQKFENLYTSPFFGQDNATKIYGSNISEIAFSRLGYLCSQAKRGRYLIDYYSPSEFLPLFRTTQSNDSWDQLIFDYFTTHPDGISVDFMKLWNSPAYSSNQAKRNLLSMESSKESREQLYRKLIEEESISEYKQKTKKETDLDISIKLDIETDLNQYLKNKSVDNETANKIKADVGVKIESKLTDNNLIEIKYYRLKLNGTFLSLIKDYGKMICKKNTDKIPLVAFEKKFYEEYMIPKKVFLITNMQYISYKINRERTKNTISSIIADINGELSKNQIPALDASFGLKVQLKVTKQLDQDFKADGGYLLQIAENAKVGQIDKNCSN